MHQANLQLFDLRERRGTDCLLLATYLDREYEACQNSFGLYIRTHTHIPGITAVAKLAKYKLLLILSWALPSCMQNILPSYMPDTDTERIQATSYLDC